MVLLLYSLAIIDTMTIRKSLKGCNKGVEMPDVRKIKNSNFCQVELYGPISNLIAATSAFEVKMKK